MLDRQTLFGRTAPKTPAETVRPPAIAGAPAPRQETNPATTSVDNTRQPPGAIVERGDEAHGNKLIVGPNIRMKGVEISDCDTLLVEGHIEATIDSRLIQIAVNGSYSGVAAIDTAEIHGAFSGELTVRKRLTVYTAGRVSGKIKYSQLVIEEGGEISGDITRLPEPEKPPRNAAVAATPAKAAMPPATAAAAHLR
jgi:cytoskeletal protein CcmA (bactofilin family)